MATIIIFVLFISLFIYAFSQITGWKEIQWPSFLIFIGSLGVICVDNFINYDVKPRFSIHKARQFRDLNDVEKKELTTHIEQYKKRSQRLTTTELRWSLASGLFTFVILQILLLLLFRSENIEEGYRIVTIVLSVLVFLYFVRKFTLSSDLSADLTEPVYAIHGSVIVNATDPEKAGYDYKVGTYLFQFDTTAKHSQKAARDLKFHDRVIIEFSPKTHYVWKITKTNRI